MTDEYGNDLGDITDLEHGCGGLLAIIILIAFVLLIMYVL